MKTKSQSIPFLFRCQHPAGILAWLLALLATAPLRATEPEKTRFLYDNTAVRVASSNKWIFPEDNNGASAQQFFTDGHGRISSVSFAVGAVGNPEGTVRVEIWDDDGGEAGSRVAVLGVIDLATLTPFDEGGDLLTFNRAVIGLEPHRAYYVVRVNADALGLDR